MSLVVVMKEGNKVCIVSDTQLTYPDQESKRHKTSPGQGGIKTVVIAKDIAVSFAGDIKFADQALHSIGSITDFDKILSILNEFHQKSQHETEFVLTKGQLDSPPLIYKISNGICSIEDFVWLGDYEAFNLFQSYRLNKSPSINTLKEKASAKKSQPNEPLFRNFKISIERKVESDAFSKLSSAMDWVIDSNISDSVGGFKVMVIFDKHFRYVSYSRSFNERLEFNSNNQFKFHGSASHGGYSVIFHGASHDYSKIALYLLQGEFGIVYERNGMGIHKAKVVPAKEAEFHSYLAKHYGIMGVFPNSWAAEKYFPEAQEAYNSRNYEKALLLFNQAIPNNHGLAKATLLFNQGITCLHLKKHELAMNSFFRALKLNPRLYFKFRKVLNQWRNDLDQSFNR